VRKKNDRVTQASRHTSNGITTEEYTDGSRRFSGDGGGVLWIESNGLAITVWREALGGFRLNSLRLAAQNMPSEVTLDTVSKFSEESRMMLAALQKGEMQFFRDIAAMLARKKKGMPEPVQPTHGTIERDDEVLGSVQKAAAEIGGVPPFDLILKYYRELAHFRSETAQSLKRKLKARGFGWLIAS